MTKINTKFLRAKPRIDKSAFIAQGAHIIGDVSIGAHSSVWYGCVLRADMNAIRIGAHTNIQDNSTLHIHHQSLSADGGVADAGLECVLEDYVTIGHGCIIHACYIERECLVGMGAVVMDGVRIGRGSIVGAGSVVTKGKVFAPHSLIIGSPARAVRTLNSDEIAALKDHALMYSALKDEYLALKDEDIKLGL